MNSLKEKLLISLGGMGQIVFYVILIGIGVINLLPMIIIGAPIWVIVIVSAVLWFVPGLQIPYLAVWIWALIVAIKQPVTWISIVFFVAFVLYFGYMIFSVLSATKKQ